MKEDLESFLQKKCPDRENIHVSNLQDITSGWETEVYSFTLEYRELEDDIRKNLILRLYYGNSASLSAKNEFQTLSLLHQIKYPVPYPFFLGDEPSYLGKPFIIMEKINGTPLGEKMLEASGTKLSSLNHLFCKLYYDLHKLDWKSSDKSTLQDEKSPIIYLSNYISWFKDEADHFEKKEFFPIIEWLDEGIPEMSTEYFSIIHGDFHPYNILITEENNSYVIDWHKMNIMDFRVDLGWTLLLVGTHISQDLRNNTLLAYEHLFGSKIPDIEYFEVLASLRRLFDLSISLSSGASEMGMRDQTDETMKKNIRSFEKTYKLLKNNTGLIIPEIEKLFSQLS